MAREYETVRRGQAATWGAAVGLESVATLAGLGVAGGTTDPQVRDGAYATAGLGVAVAAMGGVGLHYLRRRSDVSRWYSADELEEASRVHATELLWSEASATNVSIDPQIDLGYLGVRGPF